MAKTTKNVNVTQTTNVEEILASLPEEQQAVLRSNLKTSKTRKNSMTRKQFWNDAVDMGCKPNAIFNENRYIGFNMDTKKVVVESNGKVVEVDCFKEIFESINSIIESKIVSQ